jgi:hypothetical protein
MILRTRFFDDFLRSIADQHAIRQVVLMAAGCGPGYASISAHLARADATF